MTNSNLIPPNTQTNSGKASEGNSGEYWQVSYRRWYTATGTCLQGSLRSSYHTLVRLFGEPNMGHDGKTRAEWILRFDDGTIATIYDWKEYKPVEDVTVWNVGGHSHRALQLVLEVAWH